MSISVERYRAISPSEFFYRNKEIAGFSNPARALYQAVRELVENSLDATDTYNIYPDIKIIIDKEDSSEEIYSVYVEDNGIGIPPNHIPNAFGRVLYSSKYVLRQTRGMFGLGAKMVVLYGQITVGRPVEVTSSPRGFSKIYRYKIMIDIKNNEPIILEESVYPNINGWHGTAVRVFLKGDWQRSKNKILDYVKRTAIITPYANILFKDPEGVIYYYQRLTNKMPKPPKEVKPHPKGVDLETLKEMIVKSRVRSLKDFLMEEFEGVGEKTAEGIIRLAGFRSNQSIRKMSIDDLKKLLDAISRYEDLRRPSADHLSPIGEELIKIGLANMFKPEFVDALTRKPIAYEGHALIVEVGIAFGGSIPEAPFPEEIMLLRYANKIPLLYDESTDVSFKVVSEIDWKNYGVEFPARLAVLTHVCSTKVPYKGVGKESIADVPEIEKEIENGVKELARRLRQYINRKKRMEEEIKRAYTFIKYIPEVARGLSIIYDGSQDSYEKIKEKLFNMLKEKVSVKNIRSIDDVVISIE
ncbi:MAG: DNA topoisomerase VI subunit B [Desulfurococcaceae archaeon]|nr:DNA topoisomerase VI subunit B [Desulfurococcaceae archaeon]